MKRLESGKSHSWWWDSHVSPKNNKWLAENLEEMDRSVKRMLKLIEEEGDSFAKKAEMYYQKRPELISQVEDFYRMYRSLAERYDNLTGELRKNIHPELQTQGSGISDVGSESGSPLTTPDRRLSRRRSSHRAAGFEFFLGSGGSPDVSRKASDESSSTASDSGSDSDDASSKNNSSGSPANGDGAGLRRRIIELEVELRDMKEKFHGAKEENAIARSNYDQLRGRITWYEGELKVANEKLQHTEEEITRLKLEFEKAESLEITRYLQTQLESAEKDVEVRDDELKLEKTRVLWLQERISELEANVTDPDNKIGALEKELTLTNKKLEASENEIARLILLLEENKSSLGIQEPHLEFAPASQDVENRQVDHEWESRRIAGFDVSDTDSKIKALEEELRIRNEKLRFSEEEIVRLKLELENKNCSLKSTADSLQVQLDSCCRDIESWEAELQSEKIHVKELQGRIVCLEGEVSNRDHEIGELKEAVSAAEQELTLEKSQLQTVISGLSDSRALLQEQLKEWELKSRSLEGEINRVEAEKIELQVSRGTHEEEMQVEMERLRADMAERSDQGAELNNSLDALKQKQSILMAERDGLNGKVLGLIGEVKSKNNQIHQMEEHLHRLHLEHVELIAGCEGARKLVEELKKRLKEAHGEVERQRVVISDGAEQKREAIRQLCFSLEHYRNRYHRLRKAFQKRQGPELLAS